MKRNQLQNSLFKSEFIFLLSACPINHYCFIVFFRTFFLYLQSSSFWSYNLYIHIHIDIGNSQRRTKLKPRACSKKLHRPSSQESSSIQEEEFTKLDDSLISVRWWGENLKGKKIQKKKSVIPISKIFLNFINKKNPILHKILFN